MKAKDLFNIGDSCRIGTFYTALVPPLMTDKIFDQLKVSHKNIKPKRTDFSDWFTLTSPILIHRKALNFYESLFYQYHLMASYKRTYQIKYSVIWSLLIGSIIVGLAIGSIDFNRLMFTVFTLVILSLLTIQTIFLIRDWEKQTDNIAEIKEQVLTINTLNELQYLFIQYTIIVRNFPTIPDEFYNKKQPEIELELNQDKKRLLKQ